MTARRPAPAVIVLVVGLSLAVLQYVLDDRDPLVFSVPILVLTALLTLALVLNRGGASDELDRVAQATGLRDGGLAPLPAVTPILAGVRAPVRVLTGRLPGRGPRVRVAIVGDRLVSVSETAAVALDEQTGDWLVLHPLGPRAAVEDGLLVVAVPRDAGGDELLGLATEIHGRIEQPAESAP